MSNPYTPTPDGKPILGSDVQGIINGVTGVTPHVHTFRNDDDNHAVTIQNRDTANGGPHLRVLKSDDDTVLFEVTDDGVSFEASAIDSLDLPGTLGVGGAADVTGQLTVHGAAQLAGTVTMASTLFLPGPSAGSHAASDGFSITEIVSGSPVYGLQRIFTPEMYGAVRNGSTNDGPALQLCFNAAAAVNGIEIGRAHV